MKNLYFYKTIASLQDMKKYYIYDGQEQKGPFSLEELKTKSISHNTLIWYEGIENWVEASQVEELKPLITNLNTTPPAPPPISKTVTPHTYTQKHSPNKKNTAYIVLSVFGLMIVLFSIIGYISEQKKRRLELLKISEEQARAKEEALIKQRKAESAAMAIQKKIEAEIEQSKSELRKRWDTYVTADKTFRTSLLGGISDVYVTVNNNWEYPLDKVEIEVTYIRASGDTYKTEVVEFSSIPPYEKITKKAPNSDRGTNLSLRFLTVKSNKLGLDYDARYLDIDNYFKYFPCPN